MKKLSITPDWLEGVEAKKQFLTLNGTVVPKVKALFKLMKRCGVYRLKSTDDYWMLVLRTYILYGGNVMMDGLFLNEIFFEFRMLVDFDKEADFKIEENRALKEGLHLTITTEDLRQLNGLELNAFKNSTEKIFLSRSASRMPTSWVYQHLGWKEYRMLTSCCKSNYEMKQEIKRTRIIPQKHFLDSAFYANEVIKYM